jgi:cyclohexyl-isocyanide hydratase
VLYPRTTLLDIAAPYEVFVRMPATRVYLIADSMDVVRTEGGVHVSPDCQFSDAPPLDILFVPGGPGQIDKMENEEFMTFLRERSQSAEWVCSVCTGSLLLGAAGLLAGYRATTHWLCLDLLGLLGAEPVAERVVIDQNRITGAGVSAGLDLGLVVAAQFCGESVAQAIQLLLEYDPQPPFRSGSPKTADERLVDQVTAIRAKLQSERRRQIKRIAAQLRAPTGENA